MTTLSITSIRRDGGTQPRDHMNYDVAKDYAEAMVDGAVLPPITVFYDGTDYWLADGFHRVEAHLALNLPTIEADVRQGAQRDAVLYSVGANVDHGYRRTAGDKRRAVTTLLNDPEWSQWSDREIARRCGVSPTTVAPLRPRHTVQSGQYETRTFVHHKTGEPATMRTGAIGKPKPLIAGRQPDNRPAADVETTGLIGPNTAARMTGFNRDRLLRIARAGEIDGAEKDGGSWYFDAEKLREWMASTPGNVAEAAPEPVEHPPAAPAFDLEHGRMMLDMHDTIERIATAWPSPAEALAMWRADIGAAPSVSTVAAAAEWLIAFADEWPVVAAERDARNLALEE